MAEFTVVIKEIGRMCAAIGDCKGCSLGLDDDCKLLAALDENDVSLDQIAEIERIVMDWAKENPELRYPTWNEWYKATFPNSNYHTIPCPSMFYKICETSNYHGEVECYECKNQPIPADIAEKLGIKPIGGEE
jgi:hypothetical protein